MKLGSLHYQAMIKKESIQQQNLFTRQLKHNRMSLASLTILRKLFLNYSA